MKMIKNLRVFPEREENYILLLNGLFPQILNIKYHILEDSYFHSAIYDDSRRLELEIVGFSNVPFIELINFYVENDLLYTLELVGEIFSYRE